MFVRRAVDKCPRRNQLKDPKKEASISRLQKHRAYSFLGSISQIMDDVELALQPASEKIDANGAKSKISTRERKEQENQRAKDSVKTLDNDAGRTSVPELDQPKESDTKKDDDKVSEKLGY